MSLGSVHSGQTAPVWILSRGELFCVFSIHRRGMVLSTARSICPSARFILTENSEFKPKEK
jgi:hypothetical protein